MWLTSDTKFNEVILSIFLKRDDMQFWLYNIQSEKEDIFTKKYYFDSDTSRTRQVNEWGGSVLKLRDWRAIWNLTKLCEVSKNIFTFKTSNLRQMSERRRSVYNTWLRNDTKSNDKGRSLKCEKNNMVITEKRIHLFPYRTQKLSSSSLMVLRPKGLGRVGHSQL